MEKKVLLLSALVAIFCFGMLGTATAGSISYPAGVISNLDHTTAKIDAKLEGMHNDEIKVSNYGENYIPAGVISNLDHTTAELDAKLEAMAAKAANKREEVKYTRCYTPAGAISNLDHTTAELDTMVGC